MSRGWKDVPVGSDPFQGIDFYFADSDGAEHRRLAVFIHGGAWRTNSRANFSYIGEAFAQRHKTSAALVGYRLSTLDPDTKEPLVRHPSHVTDVADAIAFILVSIERKIPAEIETADHVKEANLKVNSLHLQSVAVVGHSAGGQMGGLLALDETYLKSAIERRCKAWQVPCDDWKRLFGLVNFYVGVEGIYDIPKLIEEYPDYKSFIWQAFGEQKGGLWVSGSPTRVNPANGPPSSARHLVLQSLKDELLSTKQSLIWVEHLKNLGIPVVYDETSLDNKHFELLADEAFADTIMRHWNFK
ncbi:Kynurenine formamidase [Phlyctochytrium bullatum]|nr:Kynurenine formamidase [Phlyctochytrium bullatum]